MHLYNDRIAKVRPGAACSKWLYSNVWAVTVRYSWVACNPHQCCLQLTNCTVSIVEMTKSVEKILLECQLVVLYGALITAEL